MKDWIFLIAQIQLRKSGLKNEMTIISESHCMPSYAIAVCQSLSHIRLFVTPWTVAHQSSLSTEFSRQAYRSGLPFPTPVDVLNPRIEPGSPTLWIDSLPSKLPGKP